MSLSISVALIFFSCKKANDERNDANKPPVATAGLDQVITLPTDSILLDGSASNDPDGMITEPIAIGWLWKKIPDPASFNLSLLDMLIMGYPIMQEVGVLGEL